MMSLGVPYDLYWSGDPYAVRAYIEAFEITQERKNLEADTQAWRIGAYVYEAVGVALARAIGGKKDAKYTKEPHSVTEIRKKRIDKETAVEQAFAEMNALASVYNRQKKTKQTRGGARKDASKE